MTQDKDGADPDDSGKDGSDPSRGGRKLDEDAAWRAIVAHYGDRAELESESDSSPNEPPASPEPSPLPDPVEAPRWRESLETNATWRDEGHFVPPEPAPSPPLEPRRKLAWTGLFGSPFLMLVAVVLGWQLPQWLMGALVIGFVGGFGYLVATMPRNRPDGWSGDDGAVV